MLPSDSLARKHLPIASGVLDYFPDALAAIARVSWDGNEKHNPGEPLHWAREKSTDHADCIIRHFLERGQLDEDGGRHSAKMAWRVLALLQLEIEAVRLSERGDDFLFPLEDQSNGNAIPMPEFIDPNPWREWAGGNNRPIELSPTTRVQFKMRGYPDDEPNESQADWLRWTHEDVEGDIIAWRYA